MVKEKLKISDKMETSFDEIQSGSVSLEAPMSGSTNDSMSSVTSNDQVLYSAKDSKPIERKLTIFRCPFWSFSVDPQKMTFRANIIEKINSDENQSYNRLIDAKYGIYKIVKDAFRPNVLIKRALIRSVINNTVHANFIDYGNNCQVEKENLFEYPNDVNDTAATVMLLKLMNVAPLSNLIFPDNEKEIIAKYVEKNLKPGNNSITVKIKWISKEGIFCNVTVQIDGKSLDSGDQSLEREDRVKDGQSIIAIFTELAYKLMNETMMPFNAINEAMIQVNKALYDLNPSIEMAKNQKIESYD